MIAIPVGVGLSVHRSESPQRGIGAAASTFEFGVVVFVVKGRARQLR
jgi:hypothetical protein